MSEAHFWELLIAFCGCLLALAVYHTAGMILEYLLEIRSARRRLDRDFTDPRDR